MDAYRCSIAGRRIDEYAYTCYLPLQERSQDFSKGRGDHTGSNNIVMAFSPRNIVGCLLKKGLHRGGGGVTGTPLATPLLYRVIATRRSIEQQQLTLPIKPFDIGAYAFTDNLPRNSCISLCLCLCLSGSRHFNSLSIHFRCYLVT